MGRYGTYFGYFGLFLAVFGSFKLISALFRKFTLFYGGLGVPREFVAKGKGVSLSPSSIPSILSVRRTAPASHLIGSPKNCLEVTMTDPRTKRPEVTLLNSLNVHESMQTVFLASPNQRASLKPATIAAILGPSFFGNTVEVDFLCCPSPQTFSLFILVSVRSFLLLPVVVFALSCIAVDTLVCLFNR
jgi:hypothetical protein